jgi:hypothetical protein
LSIFVKIQNKDMARLGRQVDHFINIDIDSIKADFSSDKKHRYTLRMNYIKNLLDKGRSKSLTVILKNPSSADERRSDSTIRKVETYVWQKFPDVKTLNIYNLFAYRATDAVELHHLMQENELITGVGKENDFYLKELLEQSDYLICAWGGPSAINKTLYQERINQVKEIISKEYDGPAYRVKGAKETAEPLHGLMWGYKYELLNFTL